ncbi:cytochrome P450 [Methyloceanibacter methanicus]|uniref:Cytochrome P450 n=1 Tax=Methyloceanibacter methanicus TaxID=1774968 RepID=A0A1E3W0X6_9HYPH|nr:cytochrome P450 [Methyloceanibacter methanicus]ODR99464.1 cytochrome P450 [Methyloceanibacter methanicus]
MLKPTKALRSGLPPGPKGTLIGGVAEKFGDGLLDFFLETAQTYGPVASGRVGPNRFFLASDPALIEQVLVRDARHYKKHFGVRAFIPALGNGLVTSEGAYWRGQRKLVQPAFMRARVRRYAPVMAAITEQMLDAWSPGDQLKINFEFSNLTSQIALKTLFDLDDAGDRQHFTDTLNLAFDIMMARLSRVLKVPLWFPTPETLRLNRAIAELDRTVLGFIAAGRARERSGDDLLSRLLAATREDGSRMSNRELRDETMTLYLAGHETTALALTWTWVLLSQHPHVEDKLAAEWARVLGGRTPRLEDMERLPYTHAVLTESMRLYPPVYVIGREATTDLELGGYRVKRGYTVLMSQWVNHRDPRYFPEPERFHPERWEDGLAKRIPKFAYYPFGGGQRICVGNAFSLLEAAIILAAAGQRFRFRVDADADLRFKPQITLMPAAPIPVTLEAR